MVPVASLPFKVRITSRGSGQLVEICSSLAGSPSDRSYEMAGLGQQDYLDFFAAAARDFGTRMPHNRTLSSLPPTPRAVRPLLTRSVDDRILYGYGDPAVIRTQTGEGTAYHLFVTSNDAPDAFPILSSADLVTWESSGFVFPSGEMPPWCATGAGVGDFWAPELHAAEDGFLLCYTARGKDRTLAIGIGRAPRPEGPFEISAEPLLTGGVIDAHLFGDDDGSMLLLWKQDSNHLWPGLLAALIRGEPDLVEKLFEREEDRRSALLAAALLDGEQAPEPMERFFLLQPLIEAAVGVFSSLREHLRALGPKGAAIVAAMETPIHAQSFSPATRSLVGEPAAILVNDLGWEGHLIEGPWLTRQEGRYYLFYAGNDFCTADYGIGVAVSETPLGPYRKMPEPILRSSRDWVGPGHPSVAPGPDGTPMLFFHAYPSGQGGYKAFRALLCARLRFHEHGAELID